MLKKISVFIILIMLMTFTIVFANPIVYNNGPEPNNPYYLHYKIDSYTLFPSDDMYREYYIYIPNDNINKSLTLDNIITNDIVTSTNITNINNNSEKFKVYRIYNDGSYAPAVLSSSMPFYRGDTSVSNLNIFELYNALNSNLIEYQYKNTYGTTIFFKLQILENTIPLKDKEGITQVYPMAKAPTYEIEEWLKIISPTNNFVQSGSLNQWSIRIGYQILKDQNFNLSEWEIKPHSETIKGLKVISNTNWSSEVIPHRYIQGEMKADYYVPFGTHQIYFTMTNKRTGQVLTSQTFTYKNYEDFIDNNNDGLDDRSGLDEEVGGVPPAWNPSYNQPPQDFSIPDLTSTIEQLKSFMQLLIEPVMMLFKGVNELYMLILFGFAVALIKFALGRN